MPFHHALHLRFVLGRHPAIRPAKQMQPNAAELRNVEVRRHELGIARILADIDERADHHAGRDPRRLARVRGLAEQLFPRRAGERAARRLERHASRPPRAEPALQHRPRDAAVVGQIPGAEELRVVAIDRIRGERLLVDGVTGSVEPPVDGAATHAPPPMSFVKSKTRTSRGVASSSWTGDLDGCSVRGS